MSEAKAEQTEIVEFGAAPVDIDAALASSGMVDDDNTIQAADA